MPIDYGTPVGMVRLLIRDLKDPPDQLFTDEEIQAFLTIEGDTILLAAAAAVEAIAVNEAIRQKKVRQIEHSADGPAEAEALRKLAADWRARAAAEGAVAEGPPFEVAEQVLNDFSLRDFVLKDALRSG